MLPRILIDTAEIPGGDSLRLIQRGTEFSIMLGANELMNSRLSGSEEALATLSCERILPRDNAKLLIGGLGMGFTLRAALPLIGPDAHITVAELVPAVVDWAKGPMAAHHGDSLTDPRVTIALGDVAQLIRDNAGCYDAILLDVDNGPDGITKSGNDHLYTQDGLNSAWRALRPGGVLSIWSAHPDKGFANRLRQTGFAAEEIEVRAHKGKSGARHIIWCAVRA